MSPAWSASAGNRWTSRWALCLRRTGDGTRLDHHQLVGIRRPDADQPLIADLSWLMYRSDGTLEVGINVPPGCRGWLAFVA